MRNSRTRFSSILWFFFPLLVFFCDATIFAQDLSFSHWRDWSQDYTLVVLKHATDQDVRTIIQETDAASGRITVVLRNDLLVGKIPAAYRSTLSGYTFVDSVYTDVVPPDSVRNAPNDSRAFVWFFNEIRFNPNFPYINFTGVDGHQPPPFVKDRGQTLAGMQNRSGVPFAEDVRIPERYKKSGQNALNSGGFHNYPMTGLVDVALIFTQTDGSLDANQNPWTTGAEDTTLKVIATDLATWSHNAQYYNQSLTFRLLPVRHDSSWARQPYDPIQHSKDEDSLWENGVFGNAGISSGTNIERGFAFADSLMSWYDADHAYTAFLVMSANANVSTFPGGGELGFAYFDGPMINVIYNFGWIRAFPFSVPFSSMGDIFGHETGHVFWATDEYSWVPGGTSAPLGFGPTPDLPNGNFDGDGVLNSVACVMKLGAAEQLCSYTATQVGWIDAPNFTTLKASPEGFPVIDTNNLFRPVQTPVTLPWAYGQNILLGERENWSYQGQEYTFSGWSNGSTHQATLLRVNANDSVLTAVYTPTGNNSDWQNFIGEDDGLPSSKLLGVFFDADSALWVAGINGVSRRDSSGQWQAFTPDNGFPDENAGALTQGPDGRIWTGGQRHINFYDGSIWQNFQNPPGIAGFFTDILFDKQGRMWVASIYGVAYYDSLWHTFTTEDGLTNNEALSLAEDSDGNIWVGTTNGINRWDGSQWQQFATFEGDPIPFVQDIFVDDQGNLWFASNGLGILKYDGSNWTKFVIADDLVDSQEAQGVAVDKLGNIWFSASNVLTWQVQEDSTLKQFGMIFKLSPDGTNYEVVDYQTPLTWPDARKIRFDASGTAYFATFGGGLSILKNATTPVTVTSVNDSKEQTIKTFSLQQNYPNPFNPQTNITFALPERAKVRLEVFNVLGQKVMTLVNGTLKRGQHSISFDGSHLSSGIYIYRLKAGSFTANREMILLK